MPRAAESADELARLDLHVNYRRPRMNFNSYVRDALRGYLGIPDLEVSDFVIVAGVGGRFDEPHFSATVIAPGYPRIKADFELEVEGDDWIFWDVSRSYWGKKPLPDADLLISPISVYLAGGELLRYARS